MEGPQKIFSLIKRVAIANGKGEIEQDALTKEALDKYRQGADEEAVDKYFFLSKNEMQNLVREYAKWKKAGAEVAEMQEYRNSDE